MTIPALSSSTATTARSAPVGRLRLIRAETSRGPVLILGGEGSAEALRREAEAHANGHGIANGNGHGATNGNGHGATNGNGHGAANGNGHGAANDNGHGAARQRAVGNGNGHRPGDDAGGNLVAAVTELTADNLRRMVSNQEIAEVVVADPEVEERPDLVRALLDCKVRGVRVREAVGLYEELFRKVRLETVTPRALLYGEQGALSEGFRRAKRVLDVVVATLMLVAASPLMAAIAVAIRLESPGNVIYRQERVGLRGKSFRMLKFRSMRPDAESETGPVWCRTEDDRVTRVGAFLRRYHLDELPQLINVLRGEMSLVGPRPERPCFVEKLSLRIPYYRLRHQMKPGISGWAQVEYEYGDSMEDAHQKLEYDLYYARHASVRLDLIILLRTVRHVITAGGR